MKIEVEVEVLNAIYKSARAAQDETDLETVDIHLTRIIRIHEGLAKAHPGLGLHRRVNRRRSPKGGSNA